MLLTNCLTNSVAEEIFDAAFAEASLEHQALTSFFVASFMHPTKFSLGRCALVLHLTLLNTENSCSQQQ
jgi:hypothetical protein